MSHVMPTQEPNLVYTACFMQKWSDSEEHGGQASCDQSALFNPQTSILIQKRHAYIVI